MGAKATIAGFSYPVREYTVTEATSPLAAGDSAGETGTITVTINAPDRGLPTTVGSGMHKLATFGSNILLDKAITLQDSTWGTIPGFVSSIQQSGFDAITLTCTTTLNILNAYNVQSQPFAGTLGNLIRYYVSLSGSSSAVSVDGALDGRYVEVLGWTGELWFYFKQLATAHRFEIALVNGTYTFRPLREADIPRGRSIEIGQSVPVPTLAQSVEVYRYKTWAVTNELVYPPGGWTPETEVLNVNAGEETEYTLELSASVSAIQAPTMVTSVDPEHDSSSVYTIVANDGLPIPAAAWRAGGGYLTVAIDPDTRTLTVRLRGATGYPTAQGEEATNFSVALGSDATGNRYSTLRIVGTGVAYTKSLAKFRTGISPLRTGTEVGVTIDNQYLDSQDRVSAAGVRAAAQYSGPIPDMSGQIALPGRGFGSVAGSRVIEPITKRPYRVRSASISGLVASYQADDDYLLEDDQTRHEGLTYAQVQTLRSGLSYRDDFLAGLIV